MLRRNGRSGGLAKGRTDGEGLGQKKPPGGRGYPRGGGLGLAGVALGPLDGDRSHVH